MILSVFVALIDLKSSRCATLNWQFKVIVCDRFKRIILKGNPFKNMVTMQIR